MVKKAESSPTTPLTKKSPSDKEKTTSGKKFKQTRLPFHTLSASKTKEETAASNEARKRKLSSPDTDSRSVKVGRTEDQEDKDLEVIEVDVEPMIYGEESNTMSNSDGIEKEDETEEAGEKEEIAQKSDTVIVLDDDSEADIKEEEEDIKEKEEEATESNPNESKADESMVNEDSSLEISENEDEEKPENQSSNISFETPLLNGISVNPNGKPMTPRQMEKFLEKQQRQEKRLKEKLEREKKLEEEKRQKEEREKQRKKEREQKEELKKKEKEDKEAQRQKEKEERDRKKQLELEEKKKRDEQKEEEKRKREEQKEEERRKKEEEKRKKELEEEQKKKRASQAFAKFFKVGQKQQEETKTEDAVKEEAPNQFFMPFAVKGDMKLAPNCRRQLTGAEKTKLEQIVSGEKKVEESYLKTLKSKKYIPLKSNKTWTVDSDSEDDVYVMEDAVSHKVEEIKPKEKYRAKLFLFNENRRPPYYGTWQKKSKIITARSPFGRDEKYFDYGVDSDEEWEEEEPGESLHGSDDEKDKESEDDYEVDNDFFVPHGHLSDEEMQNEEENDNDNSPETQKLKLKVLQDEFNDEMKKKTEKIKPRVIGCIWVNSVGEKPDNCPSIFWEILTARRMICEKPIDLNPVEEVEDENMADNEEQEEKQKENLNKKISIPESEVSDLIKLVHGNLNKSKFMIQEFQKFREKSQNESNPDSMRTVTNMSILRKIKEIAKWENCTDESSEMKNRVCWIVQKEYLEKYGLENYPVMNSWSYILQPKRIRERVSEKETEKTPKAPKVPKVVPPVEPVASPATPARPTNGGIAKFTKVLTSEEKKKAFNKKNNENKLANGTSPKVVQEKDKVVAVAKPPTQTPPVKKRVPLLMSFPRGQDISEQSKNMLIKNFLKKPDQQPTKPPEDATVVENDCIVLD